MTKDMTKKDLQKYTENRFAGQVTSEIERFVAVSNTICAIERMEGVFYADSYCLYYHEQDAVIREYESEFGSEAEDMCDAGQTYKASEYRQAATAYAYAIAYCGFVHYFRKSKEELIEALEEFGAAAARELEYDGEIKVQITRQCPHGWASHDRELEDGTMVWRFGQLDGYNGMARAVAGVWISCCIKRRVAVSR